ncbi:MAG: hypothetical protein AAF607_10220 [Pseudomonadota bacterium]
MTNANHAARRTLTRYTIFAAALICAGLSISPAMADNKQDMDRMLEQADQNRDGNIAWDEVVEMRTKMFSRLDRNGDGYADMDDSPKRFRGRFEQALNSMTQFDTNNDGRISKTEMLEGKAPAFEKGDTNGDNVLTAEEFSALRAARAQQ